MGEKAVQVDLLNVQWVQALLAGAETEIESLTAERDAYRDRTDALEALLAHYRFGTRPSEKLLDRLAATKAAIAPKEVSSDG